MMTFNWLFLAGGGLASGILAGLLGIGGGIILVPLLVTLGYTTIQAVGTSSLVIVISSVSGSLQNWRMGHFDLQRIAYLGLPALITAQIGVYLANQVPPYLLLFLFGILLLANIYLLRLKKNLSIRQTVEDSLPSIRKYNYDPLYRATSIGISEKPATPITKTQPSDRVPRLNPILSRSAIGSAAGILSGLFGMGGGIILVPFQMLLLREPIKVAIQTSLGVIVGTAISAGIGHGVKGNVLFLEGIILGAGGFIGAQLSTRLLPKLPDATVSLLFQSLLGVLSIYMFWQSWTQAQTPTFVFMAMVTICAIALILGAIAIITKIYASFYPSVLPATNPTEGKFSATKARSDRPSSPKWTTSILLLLVVGQSSALLWTYRNAIAKAFTDTASAIASYLPQSKSSDCEVPASIAKDRKTYLHLCYAMQDVMNVPNGQFFYGGTMGAAALRSKSFLKEIQIAHPDFRLRYLDPLSVPPDSSTGIKMLLDGELSFAESQRPLKDREYQQAKERGFTLKQIPVAMTGAAFYTHPRLHLSGLSVQQLQDIYTGKVTNWAEVGGPNLPIIPVSQDLDATGSTLSLLWRDLPEKSQKLGANIQHVRDTTAAIRKVAATPGAIGFGAQALVVNQRSIRSIGIAKGRSRNYIRPIMPDRQINKMALQDGSYPLMQRVFVVIRQDDTLDELAGIAYANLLLSEKGQTLIDRAGYLPIRFQGRRAK
jgi:uncharacterized membrane protein YfcA/ABC-type phosphate transport system substrate-binding protein